MIIGSIINQLGKFTGYNFGRHSYSQCGEDLIVAHIFSSLKKDKITYIDVGAHHPYILSNTAFFYLSGSRGINIEPNPGLYRTFVAKRRQDVNLNCGISDREDKLKFYVIAPHVLSTFSETEAKNLKENFGHKIEKEIDVQVFSLQQVIDKYSGGMFPDFLSVDVEGLDSMIIKSLALEKTKPTVICLETISYSENREGKKDDDIINYLKNKGYFIYADTNINTIFVNEEIWYRDNK